MRRHYRALEPGYRRPFAVPDDQRGLIDTGRLVPADALDEIEHGGRQRLHEAVVAGERERRVGVRPSSPIGGQADTMILSVVGPQAVVALPGFQFEILSIHSTISNSS